MTKKEYGWHIGEAPPKIELHSLTKHRVYEEYLLHYIQVLNSNPRIPQFRLALVDGFAGGGVYLDPRDNKIYPGSPLRLINAAEAAAAMINETRRKQNIHQPFELMVEYYFVEKKKENYEYLNWYLREQELGHRFEQDVFPVHGEFNASLPRLLEKIAHNSRSRRCIFFLDQYGYSNVPFDQIHEIFLRLPNAEVILTFATDWLIDYMAETPKYIKSLEKIGLNEILDVQSLLNEKSDNPQWRYLVQNELHKAIYQSSGAQYYTPFFIVSKEANRSFWLVHLSNHPRARDVMTQLHWKLKNHFAHYGGSGLRMFGYDPSKDEGLIGITDLFSSGEFSFDEVARQQTLKSIIDDLPRMIHQFPEGISFYEFYRHVANNTPATTDQIREVAEMLIKIGELDIRGPQGERRLKGNTIHNNDIIRLHKQCVIDFGREKLIDLKNRRNPRS